ncbi:hypothetical protein K435DRAFT_133063 [Dendrothele bispora CBS 962.96]|uniref:Uncharacterized protein n=1 Tax=Dendrothele bispora (strain CBS 962.96) TaxID=1314807 RepID=A0A4S8KMH3_DENBC|nr:hypothetical protein K435DRAFT_133063 [Dendrothele bispora CBS 962.96]
MPYEDDSTVEEERPILLSEKERRVFDELVGKMGLESFLDLPMIALSNGQTRRARILKAIMTNQSQSCYFSTSLSAKIVGRSAFFTSGSKASSDHGPYIRTQDTIPDWITHVALVKGNRNADLFNSQRSVSQTTQTGDIVVDLQNVKVQYQERKVLNNLNWQIRQGERWHLQGLLKMV